MPRNNSRHSTSPVVIIAVDTSHENMMTWGCIEQPLLFLNLFSACTYFLCRSRRSTGKRRELRRVTNAKKQYAQSWKKSNWWARSLFEAGLFLNALLLFRKLISSHTSCFLPRLRRVHNIWNRHGNWRPDAPATIAPKILAFFHHVMRREKSVEHGTAV